MEIGRLEESDAAIALGSESPPEAFGSADTVLGITLAPLDDAARRQYGAPDEAEGVVVTFVQSGTDAAGKVLRVGDVIEEIAWERVTSPIAAAEAAEAAAEAGKPILLLINRNGQLVFESVRPVRG